MNKSWEHMTLDEKADYLRERIEAMKMAMARALADMDAGQRDLNDKIENLRKEIERLGSQPVKA